MRTQRLCIDTRSSSCYRLALCAILLLMAAGAWGQTTYTWKGGSGGNWTNPSNWNSSPSSAYYPGYNSTDIVDIGTATVPTPTINLDANISVATVNFNFGATGLNTLNLQGNTLTVSGTLNFGTSGGSYACNADINGPGGVTTAVLDTNQNYNNYVNMTNTVAMTVNSTFYANQTLPTATTFSGDGSCTMYLNGAIDNLYPPDAIFSGVNVVVNGITYSVTTSGALAPNHSAKVTVMALSGSFNTSTTRFRYTATVRGTGHTYTVLRSDDITTDSSFSATTSTGAYVSFAETAQTTTTFVFYINIPNDSFSTNDSMTLTIYDPSLNIPVGSVSYTYNTNDKVWIGGDTVHGTATAWSNNYNWSGNAKPTGTSIVSIPSTSNNPVLDQTAVASSVTVEYGATLDFAGNNMTATSITNYGTVRFNGSETAIPTTKTSGASSIVEYYGGTTSSPVWGTSYQGLTVSSGGVTMSGATSVSGAFLVSGGTLATGSDILTLNGASNQVASGGTLTVSSGGSIAASGNPLSIAGILNTSGPIACGNFTTTGTVNNAASNTLTASGNVSVSNAFNFPGNSSLVMTGTRTISASAQLGSFTIGNSNAVTISASALGLAGLLTINSGSLDMAGNDLTVSGAVSLAGGSLTHASGTLTASSLSSTGGTYTGTGNGSLTLSGLLSASSGTLTLGAKTITGVTALTASGTSALDLGSATVSMSGNLTISTSGTVKPGSGTITMTGSGVSLNPGSASLHNLIINSSGTVTLNSALVLAASSGSGGDLTISSGTLGDSGNYAITLDGSWSNAVGSSGFTYGASTVTFSNGNSETSHGVSGTTTFYGFSSGCSSSTGAASLNFATGSNTYIASGGLFSIAGASGYLLSLTGTGIWNLYMGGSASVSYAYIKYSDLYTTAVTPSNSTSGGYNDLVDTTIRWNIATSYQWNGGDGSWATSASWTPNAPPGGPISGDTVVLPNGFVNYPTLSASVTSLASLTMNGSSTLTLASNSMTATSVTKAATTTLILNGGETVSAGLLSAGITRYVGTGSYTITQATYTTLQFQATGTFNFSNLVSAGSAAITASASTVKFNAGLTVTGTLSSTAVAASLSIAGNAASSVATASLAHTGGLTLGSSSSDGITFTNGLTYTVGTSHLAGGLATSGNNIVTLQTLVLDAAATFNTGSGAITVNTTITNTSSQNLTIANAGGLTFSGAVGTNALPLNTVTLTASSAAIQFNGGLYAATLNTSAAPTFALQISGGTSVIGTASLTNSGGLTLGQAATDSVTFTNGLAYTAGTKTIYGYVLSSSSNNINLGSTAITVSSNAYIGGTTGTITLGAVTINAGNTLDLGDGSAATVSGSSVSAQTNNSGTLDIDNAGGNVTFSGNVGVAGTALGGFTIDANKSGGTVTLNGALFTQTLSTNSSSVYNIALNNGGTVSNTGAAVTFSNAGTLTIGDAAADSFTFSGGVVATAPSSVTVNGTVSAGAGTGVITLGDNNTPLSVNSNSTIGSTSTGTITLCSSGTVTIANGATLTVGGGAATAVSTGAIATGGAASGLTINTTGAVTIGDLVSLGTGTAAITNSGGVSFGSSLSAGSLSITTTTAGTTISVAGNLTLTTGLTTSAVGYNLSFTGTTNSIAGNTTFSNSGLTTLGDASTDSITFATGATATSGLKSFAGSITATSGSLAFGTTSTTLTADTTLTASAGTGAISLGSVGGTGCNLSATAGTGASSVSGAIGGAGARLSSSSFTCGGTFALNSVYTSGTQAYSATTTTLNGSSYDTSLASGTGLSWTGAVVLGASVGFTTLNANMTTSGTVNATSAGGQGITLALGSGTWTAGADIGASFALGTLTRTSGTLAMGGHNLYVAGDISGSGGAISSSATVYLNGTTQSVNLSSTTLANLTLSAAAASTVSAASPISLSGNLEVYATRTLGMTTYNLSVAGTTNAVATSNGTITSSSGTQSFAGNFEIGSLTTSSVSTTFGSVGSASPETVKLHTVSATSGTVYFVGNTSYTTQLSSNAASLYNVTISSGTLVPQDTATVQASLTIASGAGYTNNSKTLALSSATAGTISDNNATKIDLGVVTVASGAKSMGTALSMDSLTVNSGSLSTSTNDLTVTNAVSLAGGTLTHGNSTLGCGSMSVSGGTYTGTGNGTLNVTTSLSQTSGSSDLGSKAVNVATLSATGGSFGLASAAITISGASGANTLAGCTLTNTASGITLQGTSSSFAFNGSASIGDLTVDATGITLTDSGAATDAASLTINASRTVTGLTGTVTTSGNGIFNGTLSGAGNLYIGGTSQFNASSITTTGTQTYFGNATLGTNLGITASTVTFDGTVGGGGSYSLGITGAAVFGDAVADSVTGLTSLSVSGTTAIYTDTITTIGTQGYTLAVTLYHATTLTTTNSTITFTNGVTGAFALTLAPGASGSASFGAVVGSPAALSSLTLSSGTLNTNAHNVTVSGTIDVSAGTLNLGGGGTINVGGNLVLGALFSTAMTTGSTLYFDGSGAQGFTTNGQSLYNATLANSAGATLTVTGDMPFITGGVLTLAQGTLQLGASTNTITLGANLSVGNANAPVLNLNGGTLTDGGNTYNVTVGQGTFSTGLGATPGTGSITIAGTFAVNNGSANAYVGSRTFTTGAMTVSAGAFTQTNDNTGYTQQVASLLVSGGSCTWDSNINGGTLTIVGAGTQTGGNLAFNNKNVTVGTQLTGTFEFYDLVIPSPKTLTPAASAIITVRHSMQIASGGGYSAANNPSLVLGGANSVAGGTYTDSNATKMNLGALTVSGNQAKTLQTDMRATSLSITSTALTGLELNAHGLVVDANLTGNGTLTASGGELIQVGGDFIVNGFTYASSTVELNTAANASIGIAAGYTFYNLNVNKTSAGATITPAGQVTVANTLSLSEGNWIAGSNSLFLTAGNWDSSGSNFTFTAGSGTVRLDSAAPTITQKPGDSFYNLTLQSGGSLGSDVVASNNFVAANNAAGTLTLGTRTLNVAGNFTLTANATVSAGSSTVNLDGATQAISTNGQHLNNLKLAAAAGTATVSAGSLNVDGNLDVYAGRTLSMGGNDLAVGLKTNNAAGAVGSISSAGGTQTFTGDFTVGSLTASTTNSYFAGSNVVFNTLSAPSGTINFNGTAQSLTTSSQSFNNVALSSGSGTVTVSGTFTIGGTLEVNSGRTLSMGSSGLSVTGATNGTAGNAGAITAGTGTLSFTGAFQIGSLTASSTTASPGTTFFGNVTLNTFAHNNGTVYLAGSTGSPTFTPNGAVFKVLSVTRSAGTVATPTLTPATGSFTTANYAQSGAGGTFTLSSGATMTVSSSLQVTGGTLNLTGIYAGGSTSFAVGTPAGAVNVGTSSFSTGAVTISAGGAFSQSGTNPSVTLASLGMSGAGASCTWGSATVGVVSLSITGGSLDLGSSTFNVSGTANVVSPSTSAGTGSVINLNGSSGSLTLNRTSGTIGTLNVNQDTTLVSASGGVAGQAIAVSIASGKYLYLDSSSGALSLYLGTATSSGSFTATGTLQVNNAPSNMITLSAVSPASYPFIYTGTDIAYSGSGQAITIDGINAASLATTIGASTSVTLGGANTFASVTLTASSSATLAFAASETLACGDFTANSGTIVANSGANTLTSSGNVLIAGTFSASANSTLVMTGSSKTLAATPQIGNLHVGVGTTGTAQPITASVTLVAALSLAGSVEINDEGSFTVSSNTITLAGNWTNRVEAVSAATRFSTTTGTVYFTGSLINVYGNNCWYIFSCKISGATIYFQTAMTQTIMTGGKFQIGPSSGTNLTITRIGSQVNVLNDGTTPASYWLIGDAPLASEMWQFDLKVGATLDMANVNVMYSDARADPVAIPSSTVVVNALATFPGGLDPSVYVLTTCYQWISGLPIIYSYAEDSDGDGKIDRIRCVATAPITADFSGFAASVAGYSIDTTKGVNGYMRVPSGQTLPSGYGGDGYEFFIYLVENSYDDTGALIVWHITKNTSVMDASSSTLYVNTLDSASMKTIDGAKPRIAYTLALPSKNQVFFHFSENVYKSSGLSAIDNTDFTGVSSISRVTISGNGTSEILATYPSAISAASIAAATNSAVSPSISDAMQTPTDFSTGTIGSYLFTHYGFTPPKPYNVASKSTTTPNVSMAWPTTVAATPYNFASGAGANDYLHRVSDLMIDLPPPVSGTYDPATYFAWPIYAKDQVELGLTDAEIAALSAAQTAAEGIGLIRAFDGSQWLRPQTLTIQSRVSSALGASQPSIYYDRDVAASYKGTNGLWLPTHPQTAFSGIDAMPDTGAVSRGSTQVASGLWDFSVPSADAKVKGAVNNSVFDFFMTLSTAPSDLYVARLNIASGAVVPSNWYALVKPFSFYFHSVVLQRGGVTILNNVIDPTKGETVRLSYQQDKSGSVTVTVFTLDGDVVARLVNESNQSAGDHAVSWDGKNLGGRPVARGLYFIRLVGPSMDEIRKVIVVRK